MLEISTASTCSVGEDTTVLEASSAAETADNETTAIRTISNDTKILLFILISLHKVIN